MMFLYKRVAPSSLQPFSNSVSKNMLNLPQQTAASTTPTAAWEAAIQEFLDSEISHRLDIQVDEATERVRVQKKEERQHGQKKRGLRSLFSWLVGNESCSYEEDVVIPEIVTPKAKSIKHSGDDTPTRATSGNPGNYTTRSPFRSPYFSGSRSQDRDDNPATSRYELCGGCDSASKLSVHMYDAQSTSRARDDSGPWFASETLEDAATPASGDRMAYGLGHEADGANGAKEASTMLSAQEQAAYALMRSLDCEFETGRETQNMFRGVLDHFKVYQDDAANQSAECSGTGCDGFSEHPVFGRFSVRPTPSSPRTRGEYDAMLATFLQQQRNDF